MRFHPVMIAGFISLLLVLAACGSDADSNNENPDLAVDPAGITIEEPWIRPAILPEGHPTSDPSHDEHDHGDHDDHSDHGTGVISAMYLTISNTRSQAVQLTAVETDVAGIVEIHQTENQNGLMRMRPVESVEISANGTVEFAPGGYHIMLIDISEQLEPGDSVEVTLIFNTGERIELPDVPVIDQ